ncbi:hypothetical protein B0T16DRAFT_388487 [Cercophora newfieldiana]|uniref:Uncharacterized protein n=1 Tax=Cercophora newfieldiana TaxID=92897 RepID=A0AA39YAV6_9PEZI|nr:hypothetical protein B0T16DRAFT_388487 [Cercophora newfieldiana]
MAPSTLPVLIGLLTSTPLTLAAFNSDFGGYATDSRIGPYNANSTYFLSLLSQSNATGTFSLPLPDVSKPYPGAPIDGWTLSISMLDIPDPSPPKTGDESILGYATTLTAPPSLLKPAPDGTKLVAASPEWGMCLWNFGEPSRDQPPNNPDNKPLSPDGSCSGFLSEACIAALEKGATDSWQIVSENKTSHFGSKVTCSSLSAPAACGYGPGNSGSAVRSYQGVPVPFLNGSVTTTDGWYYREENPRYRANSTEEVQMG